MALESSPGAAEATEDLDAKLGDIEYSGRKHGPRLALVVSLIAASWSLFQLWIASPLPFALGVGIIVDVPARGIHLAFGLLLCFLVFPASKRMATDRIPWYDLILSLLGAASALYLYFGYEGLVSRQGVLLAYDMSLFGIEFSFPFEVILGSIGIALLLEATRRSIGIPLVIVALVFLIYSVFGQSMPEMISHKGVSLTRLVGYQWLGGEAIFGIPIGVSVSFVFLFVLFGALLDKAGAGRYFLNMAFAMVGRFRGGPAKAAILASGMTGLISGSSIANVVTTGTFTIPVMTKMGMPATKAGAIEVAASTNGQIMPPIMGAAAFIIAEFIGVTYFDVIVAAFIPATIAYIALFYISHLEAMKLGLVGLPRAEIPQLKQTFLGGTHYLVPIVVLIYLLIGERWTASSSVFYSIIAMMMIILAQKTTPKGIRNLHLAAIYALPVGVLLALRWIVGLPIGDSLNWAYLAALIVMLALAVAGGRSGEASYIDKLTAGLGEIFVGLVAGARNMINIAIAVAAAGIIVGSVSSTGLNNALIGVVEAISGGNIYILLALTSVLCLLLGMGLPTTANYIVVASLLAGVVVELGKAAGLDLPLIAVHLYVFYFGLMADVTPPVCLAAYAASAISRADPMRTGAQAFLYEVRTWILPVVFIFNLELLLIGVENFWHGLMVFVISLVAILAFSCITQRWMLVKLRLYEMALLAIVVVALFRPGVIMDQLYPEFRPLDLEKFIAGEAAARPGYSIRIHAVRQTNYGDRFKLFRMATPNLVGQGPEVLYGVKIERTDDGRYRVANLAFNSLAEQAGMEQGDLVSEVDVEQVGLPPKQLVYPFAFILLGLVIVLQLMRRRRSQTAAPGAP